MPMCISSKSVSFFSQNTLTFIIAKGYNLIGMGVHKKISTHFHPYHKITSSCQWLQLKRNLHASFQRLALLWSITRKDSQDYEIKENQMRIPERPSEQ